MSIRKSLGALARRAGHGRLHTTHSHRTHTNPTPRVEMWGPCAACLRAGRAYFTDTASHAVATVAAWVDEAP